MTSGTDPIEWVEDLSPAGWIVARLHPFLQDVGSVIPEGFEAYARLLHPVEPGHGRRERWSDLARRNHGIVHPEMQFHQISRPAGQRPPREHDRGTGPSWGSLPLLERRVLVEVLGGYTTTADACWFCLWEGYRPLSPRMVAPSFPAVELPSRRYHLYAGPLATGLAALPSHQSPNLWWPEDHAWFVATEIDYAWTYIGGPQALVDRLMSDDRLEVLPAALDHQPFYESDVLNAALDSE